MVKHSPVRGQLQLKTCYNPAGTALSSDSQERQTRTPTQPVLTEGACAITLLFILGEGKMSVALC